MPQNAYNKTQGRSRSDGPAIGMTKADHAQTRTYAGRGKRTMREDAGLNARQQGQVLRLQRMPLMEILLMLEK